METEEKGLFLEKKMGNILREEETSDEKEDKRKK